MLEPKIKHRYASPSEIVNILDALRHENYPQWRVGIYKYKDESIDRPFFHSKKHEWMTWKDMIQLMQEEPYGSQRGSRRELDECISINEQDFTVARVSSGGWFVPTHFDNLWNVALCVYGIRIFECSPPSQEMPKYHSRRYIIRAGDAIYIPPGWWHQVSNPANDLSILINGQDPTKPDTSDTLDQLYSAYWPGRAFEQDNSFDTEKKEGNRESIRNGYDLYVLHKGHMYHDMLPFYGRKDHYDHYGPYDYPYLISSITKAFMKLSAFIVLILLGFIITFYSVHWIRKTPTPKNS